MDPFIPHDEDEDYEEDRNEQKKPRKSAAGRKLMRWTPDVDQLILLTVDAICVKLGTPIPWDLVAKEIEPFLTGEALKQHLAKVYRFREEHGRRVPEKLEKGARRKTSKLVGPATATAPKSAAPQPTSANGGRKKTKAVGDDAHAGDATAGGAGGNATSLLWFPPPKKTKAIKKGPTDDVVKIEPETPKAGRNEGSRKKSSDDSSPANLTKSTGKRGRKTIKAVNVEDDWDAENDSPTKKQKTLRRQAKQIDYNEHLSDEDVFDAVQEDDNDTVYEEVQESPKKAARTGSVKKERTSLEEDTAIATLKSPSQQIFSLVNLPAQPSTPGTRPVYQTPNGHRAYVKTPEWDKFEKPSFVEDTPIGGFGGFRDLSGGPLDMPGHFSGNHFSSQEPHLRETIPRTISSLHDETKVPVAETPGKQQYNVYRKDSVSKGKRPTKEESPEDYLGDVGCVGGIQKIEFSQQRNINTEMGEIPIANDTGSQSYPPTPAPPAHYDFGFDLNSGLGINTTSFAPQTPQAQIFESPLDYTAVNNPFYGNNYTHASTTITPAFTRFGFGDPTPQDTGTQFSQPVSHNDSFVSVAASQSVEVPIGMGAFGGGMDVVVGEPFDAAMHEYLAALADDGGIVGGEEERFYW